MELTAEVRLIACEIVHRYAMAIDERDWVAYRKLFADEVHVDISSFNGRPPSVVDAEQWVAGARSRIEALSATQHGVSTQITDGSDQCVTVTAHVRAMHLLDDAWCELGGIYRHRVQLSEAGGVLTGVSLQVLWWLGDRGLFARAYERAGLA